MEGFEEFKQKKCKEILLEKRRGQIKDSQITKLQRDGKNKDRVIIK